MIFLRNTRPYVTVHTLHSSAHVPAIKQVTEFTVAYHWIYSRATYWSANVESGHERARDRVGLEECPVGEGDSTGCHLFVVASVIL